MFFPGSLDLGSANLVGGRCGVARVEYIVRVYEEVRGKVIVEEADLANSEVSSGGSQRIEEVGWYNDKAAKRVADNEVDDNSPAVAVVAAAATAGTVAAAAADGSHEDAEVLRTGSVVLDLADNPGVGSVGHAKWGRRKQ